MAQFKKVSACSNNAGRKAIKQSVKGFCHNVYTQTIVANIKDNNVTLSCKRGDYYNFFELFKGVKVNYLYKNVKISFYGKNNRTIKIGRSFFCVSESGKTCTREFFLPDLCLAQRLVKSYDYIKPYGFNKSFWFKNVTMVDIVAFFENKFMEFKLHSLLKRSTMPTWCKNRIHNLKDYEYWTDVYEKYMSADIYGHRNDKYILGEPTNRAKRTVFIKNHLGEYHRQEGCLYSIVEDYLNDADQLGAVSLWTDGFWLFVHLADGSNRPITHSWVNEVLDAAEVSKP